MTAEEAPEFRDHQHRAWLSIGRPGSADYPASVKVRQSRQRSPSAGFVFWIIAAMTAAIAAGAPAIGPDRPVRPGASRASGHSRTCCRPPGGSVLPCRRNGHAAAVAPERRLDRAHADPGDACRSTPARGTGRSRTTHPPGQRGTPASPDGGRHRRHGRAVGTAVRRGPCPPLHQPGGTGHGGQPQPDRRQAATRSATRSDAADRGNVSIGGTVYIRSPRVTVFRDFGRRKPRISLSSRLPIRLPRLRIRRNTP